MSTTTIASAPRVPTPQGAGSDALLLDDLEHQRADLESKPRDAKHAATVGALTGAGIGFAGGSVLWVGKMLSMIDEIGADTPKWRGWALGGAVLGAGLNAVSQSVSASSNARKLAEVNRQIDVVRGATHAD